MKFKTVYDSHDRVFSKAGEKFHVLYGVEYDEHGHKNLVKKGNPVDIRAEINSHAESVDIHVILDRFARTGDVNLINRRTGEYLDLTQFPKTYAEAFNQMAQAEDFFTHLPASEKAKFNNSYAEFMASYGTDKFLSVFVNDVPKVEPAAAAPIQEKGEVNE